MSKTFKKELYADAFSAATGRWTQAVTANVDVSTNFQELFNTAVLRLSRHIDNDDAIRGQIEDDAKQSLASYLVNRVSIRLDATTVYNQALIKGDVQRIADATGVSQVDITNQILSSPEMQLAPAAKKRVLVQEITDLRNLDLAKAEAHDRLTVFETTLATRENEKGIRQGIIDADPGVPENARREADLRNLEVELGEAAHGVTNVQEILTNVIAEREALAQAKILELDTLMDLFDDAAITGPGKAQIIAPVVHPVEIDVTTLSNSSFRTRVQQLQALSRAIEGKDGQVHGWLYNQILEKMDRSVIGLLSYFVWEQSGALMDKEWNFGENELMRVVGNDPLFDVDQGKAFFIRDVINSMS